MCCGRLITQRALASDSGARGRVRYLPPACCVFEIRHVYSPKSTGNTQEAVASSRHDCKIVYLDVEPKQNQNQNKVLQVLRIF